MQVKPISLLILALVPFCLAGTYASITSPYIGFVCEQGTPTYCALYKVEYYAQVGVSLKGEFKQTSTFALQLANQSLVRLIFYCNNGSSLSFCQNSPFAPGQELNLKGTLIYPSQAAGFISDLYVIQVF